MVTPKKILYDALAEIYTLGLDKDESASRKILIDKWDNSFTALTHYDVEEREVPIQEVQITSDLDELWGEDIGASITDELGINAEPVIDEEFDPDDLFIMIEDSKTTLYGHISEGLTKTQLERMGFMAGGIVITLLVPAVEDTGISMDVNDKINYAGKTYSIVDVQKAVKWELLDGEVFIIINCF